jgi:hypothetical protein
MTAALVEAATYCTTRLLMQLQHVQVLLTMTLQCNWWQQYGSCGS